jgi:hypothetical protein
MKRQHRLLLIMLILTLPLGLTTTAWAASPEAREDPLHAQVTPVEDGSLAVVPQRLRRVSVRGEVTAVGDSFLKLRTPDQDELLVLITDKTLFRIPGDDDPGLEDIAVGDKVGVIGYRNKDGNLVAKGVAKLPKNVQRHIVRGEVTAIEGRSLRVSTGAGSVTVHTDENTRFRIPGVNDPGLDDIAVGDHIVAAGRWNKDGSLQALLIGKPRQRSQVSHRRSPPLPASERPASEGP